MSRVGLGTVENGLAASAFPPEGLKKESLWKRACWKKWFQMHWIDDAMGVFGTQVWSYRANVLPVRATDTFSKAHGGAKSRTERAIERPMVVMARQKSPHSP